MSEVVRTVVVKSTPLPRKLFRVFVELEGMYRNMVEQLVLYAARSGVTSFTKLKALKYGELRSLYPQLPSHYAYTACQDASTRVKGFLKRRKKGLAKKDYPVVNRVSIWLDDHLWRMRSLTSIEIATHRDWVAIELEPHKQYWRYVNSGWRLASEAKIKLDKRSRRLITYLVFKKSAETYESRGFISVDVNENHVAVLVDDKAFLFETGFKDIVLGYYYRRRRVQERYDKLYGVNCRVKRRIFRKLKERRKKSDLKWKLANIVVRVAREKQYAVVLEELGEEPAREMINHVKDDQLRHRVYQASFKGVQRAIEEKAREYSVPVVYVNPRNTSRMCPVHNAGIIYSNGCRIGRCSKGGELWHRDVVACYNLLFRARLGNGSTAPSLGGLNLDGSPIPLGSTATHDPTGISKSLWARWKSLEDTTKPLKTPTNTLQGQTGNLVRGVTFRVRFKVRSERSLLRVLHALEGKVLVLDEAQELRRSGYRFDSLIAYAYDHLDLKIIVSGSMIGLLYRFLRINDPEAPLYGRAFTEVKLRKLSDAESREFLIKGFEQEGVRVSDEVINEAIRRFDGVIGWLTYFGFALTTSGEDIDSILDKASKLALSELEHALRVYGVGERRYREVLKIIATLGRARWSEVKRGVEARLGRIPNNTLATIIKNLADSGFIRKENEEYEIADPVLQHGIRKYY